MEDFELKLRISPSDTQFKKLVGQEIYSKIKSDVFKKNNFTCKGCGFHPFDENKAMAALSLHVIDINEESPENSECNVLCMACHSTQHIDIALEKEWVQLVNSVSTQKSLIEMCRLGVIHNSIKEDDTRYLKISPAEFLNKLKDGLLTTNNKVKVIFTNKFEFGDL